MLAYMGLIAGWQFLFGVVLPYIAIVVFIIGMLIRILKWAKSPVPFKITTTCGQQKSLPWIKSSNLEAPHNTLGVIGRMFLEILFFRSLFRNTKMSLSGDRVLYGSDKWLWLGGLVFHWSFFVIVMRHLRFFLEPVPSCVTYVQDIDGLLQIGVPVVYMTGLGLLLGATYLFLRRVMIPQVNRISLVSDYFPLFLIISIATTGLLLRHTSARVDIVKVKELAMGLVGFSPTVPEGIGAMFFIHLFLVSILLIYFPMSKLVHMGGVFLSPTRNMKNDNRIKRHINPWNYPVKVHTYEEWEDEFRDVMKDAGMPLEKE
jgi:nitrate reductase gamma subunit